jgi:hypothetical protein
VQVDFDKGLARVPKFIIALGLIGTGIAGRMGGIPYAAAFLGGAGAAYFNFYLLERFATRLGKLAVPGAEKSRNPSGVRLFIRFAFFIIGAFVILRLSGFNVVVAMCGFLVCPAAVMIEIFYELLTYGHS